MNSEWKEVFDEAMEREADAIMEEVNSDPTLKDVEAPPGMYEEIMKMIHEHEMEEIYEQLSDKDREYLEIGKAYMKRRKLNRYIVLVAAMVFVLAFGTVSIGEKQSVFSVISTMLSGRERTTVNSEDAKPISYVDEEEVFEDIEKEYGFTPVKFGYLPENTIFYEAAFNKEIQNIQLIYEIDNTRSLIYIIRPNYRDASFGTDVEDEKKQEYRMEVNDVNVIITEYIVYETGENKWSICFIYDNVTYMVRTSNIKQQEIERIVMNLEFI